MSSDPGLEEGNGGELMSDWHRLPGQNSCRPRRNRSSCQPLTAGWICVGPLPPRWAGRRSRARLKSGGDHAASFKPNCRTRQTAQRIGRRCLAWQAPLRRPASSNCDPVRVFERMAARASRMPLNAPAGAPTTSQGYPGLLAGTNARERHSIGISAGRHPFDRTAVSRCPNAQPRLDIHSAALSAITSA